MKSFFRFLAKPVPRKWEIARDYNDGDYLKCAVLTINLLMFIYAAGLVVASLVRFGLHGGYIEAVNDWGSGSPELLGASMHLKLIYVLLAMGLLSVVLLVIRFFRKEESKRKKLLMAIGSAGTAVFGGILIFFLTHGEVAIKLVDKTSGKLGYILIGAFLLFAGTVVLLLFLSAPKETAGAFMPVVYFLVLGPCLTLLAQNILVLLLGAVMCIVIIAGIGFFAMLGDGAPSGGGSSSSGSSSSRDNERKKLNARKAQYQKEARQHRIAADEVDKGNMAYIVTGNEAEANRRAAQEKEKKIQEIDRQLEKFDE